MKGKMNIVIWTYACDRCGGFNKVGMDERGRSTSENCACFEGKQ